VFAFVILIVSIQMFFTTSEFKITKEFPGVVIKAFSAFLIRPHIYNDRNCRR